MLNGDRVSVLQVESVLWVGGGAGYTAVQILNTTELHMGE